MLGLRQRLKKNAQKRFMEQDFLRTSISGRAVMAAELDASDSDVLVYTGNQEGDLYNEHD